MALADIWRKTLIYFGIAEEEEDDYYEEDTLAPHEELEQSYQERPNVKRIDRGGKPVADVHPAQTLMTSSLEKRTVAQEGTRRYVPYLLLLRNLRLRST